MKIVKLESQAKEKNLQKINGTTQNTPNLTANLENLSIFVEWKEHMSTFDVYLGRITVEEKFFCDHYLFCSN